jgi:hypothetical protein
VLLGGLLTTSPDMASPYKAIPNIRDRSTEGVQYHQRQFCSMHPGPVNKRRHPILLLLGSSCPSGAGQQTTERVVTSDITPRKP